MIIDRLVLRNFKRFRNEEIRFRDGITGILGNNGTGKSSIVEAVFFALYGVQATGISGDYIVSSFASKKEKCEVRLDFRIGGESYQVHRTFKKGKTVQHDASFYHKGKERAKGVSDVEAEVKRTLGMGPVDFRNTIYAAQKDLLTLLENTPGKRKEWFLRALGIDYLNRNSQEILRERAETKTGELRGLEGELNAMTGRQSPEELAALQGSVATSTAVIGEHTERKALLRNQRTEIERQQRVLADRKTNFARLQQQQEAIRQELGTDTAQATTLDAALALIAEEEAEYHRIEKAAGSYEEVRGRLDRLQQHKAEHARLSGELRFVNREITDLASRAEKQQALIAGLDHDRAEIARLAGTLRSGLGAGPEIPDDRLESAFSYRLAEMMQRIGTIAARQDGYRAEREKLAADLEKIRSAGADGICPLCRQKLGAHFGSLDAEFSARLQEIADKAVADLEKQEQLKKEQVRIESLRPTLDTVRTLAGRLRLRAGYEAELAELRQKQERTAREAQILADALTRLAYDDAAYQAAGQEAAAAQKVQARFIELGKKIGQAATRRQQLAELAARIGKRKDDLAKLEQEIAASVFDPDEEARVEAALKETDAQLRNEEIVIANARKDKAFAEEKIAAYRQAEKEIAALRNTVSALQEEIELLKLTRSIIADYVIYLMQVVRSRLEGEVSRIIGEITSGRYEQVLLDEDFNLLVRDIDDDYAIDRFSGGEQDDIAVALRIALSRYLAELHGVHESTVLIFDEIFGSQDEERRANLLTALRSQESRFPQIILISHIAEIQGEFANTLMVEMGTDQSSRVREAA
jgi:exonuclease SbcC